MREDDAGMNAEDQEAHTRAFETIDIQTRDGHLVLGFGRAPDDPNARKDPVKLLMTYGQAMALQKALGIGMAKLRGERAHRRDGA